MIFYVRLLPFELMMEHWWVEYVAFLVGFIHRRKTEILNVAKGEKRAIAEKLISNWFRFIALNVEMIKVFSCITLTFHIFFPSSSDKRLACCLMYLSIPMTRWYFFVPLLRLPLSYKLCNVKNLFSLYYLMLELCDVQQHLWLRDEKFCVGVILC